MYRIITKYNYYNYNIFNKFLKYNINPILIKVYINRGIKNLKELNYNIKFLINYKYLFNIKKITNFIFNALIYKKKITIVADYDCDGATSCCILYLFLKNIGIKVNYIVPNRFKSGYGLTKKIIDEIILNKNNYPDIIITVDNGMASSKAILYAEKKNIEVIITDHHLPSNDLINNKNIIINPNQEKCYFLSKNLCGVGVVFYILISINNKIKKIGNIKILEKNILNKLIGLVAIGTLADSVKLDYNNRILVSNGIKNINKGIIIKGLKILLNTLKLNNNNNINEYIIDISDICFLIAPIINSAGRVYDMSFGIELLININDNFSYKLCNFLLKLNCIRKNIENNMIIDVNNILKKINTKNSLYAISIFNKSWHEGIIGILASRLKDKYNCPCIVFTLSKNNILKGSGRSITDINLKYILDEITNKYNFSIINYGGHSMAVGLSIKYKNFKYFCKLFKKIIKKKINKKKFFLNTDGFLNDNLYNKEFINLINKQIWGNGFESPIFYSYFKVLKKNELNNRHLILTLKRKKKLFNAIWFNCIKKINNYIKLAFRLNINKKNNEVQLIIIEINNI